MKGYLDTIKAYLKYIINNLQKSDTWYIQLTIAINVVSCKYIDGERVMYSKSDKIEVMSQTKLLNNLLNYVLLDFKLTLKQR